MIRVDEECKVFVLENLKRRVIFLINDEINKVREKLNIMIENGEQPDEIYEVSKELDELIIKYYKEQI